MNCLNQSKLTESWCQKWTRAKPTLAPTMTEKHVVVTILEPTHLSQPPPTIHYTYNEKLDKGQNAVIFLNQSENTQSWCEM